MTHGDFLLGVRLFALSLLGGSAVVLVRGDWADQKILNRHLKICAALGMLAYLALVCQSLFLSRMGGEGFVLGAYYRAVLLHMAVAAAAAMAMWQLRMWPAGDAKLFLLLSFLFPLATVPDWFDPWRQTLVELINIFIPAALVMVGRAAYVVWKLYLDNQARFLSTMGWRSLLGYLLQGLQSAKQEWAAVVASWRERLAHPADTTARFLVWASSMALTSMAAMRINGLVNSMLLDSGIIFLLMLAWQRATRRWGRLWVALTGLALAFCLRDRGDPEGTAKALRFLTSISVFSLSLQWGFGLARRLLQERGLVYAPALGLVTWLIPMILMQVLGFGAWGRMLLTWSVLGVFFGLGNMLVRILEQQDRPILSLEQLRPFVVLAPDFVELLQKDEDFFEEHFSSLYADGLTKDQVEALQDWCRRNSVAWVPLSETVSFAFWIFLGFGITLVLKSHVLKILY